METKNIAPAQNDFLKNYLKKISKIKPLSPQDEKMYARLVQKGDRLAKKILIESNLKLVLMVAKKSIHKTTLNISDLIQEGNLGLMIAVDKFNPDLGFKFSTYATWWIKQAMFKAISEQAYCMKIPVYVQETISKYQKIKIELERKNGGNVQNSEIAKKMNMEEEKIDTYLNAFTKTISLEAFSDQNDDKSPKFADMIEDKKANTEEEVEFKELKRDIAKVIDTLNLKEKEVIKMRFGISGEEEHTLKQIGDIYNVTKECIRQTEKRVLKKLFEQSAVKNLLFSYIG